MKGNIPISELPFSEEVWLMVAVTSVRERRTKDGKPFREVSARNATGNLALRPSSPVIDEGVTCSPGGVAGPDAAGNNRRFGPSVDMGAYEFGAGQPGLVLVGTSGPDLLTGGPGNDILCGYGGGDTLNGKGGNDYLAGGNGLDRLHGGLGNDRLYGGPANDLLCAKDGSGGDYLNGGRGTDSYRADRGDVKVSVERLGNCAAGP